MYAVVLRVIYVIVN